MTELISPGVRLATDPNHGHIGTRTPERARNLGANYVVVGRPIMTAADPVAAAKRYLEALKP